jgi:hypothetical protein
VGHDVADERPIDLVRVRYVDGDGCEHVVRLKQAAGVSFEDARMARSIPTSPGGRRLSSPRRSIQDASDSPGSGASTNPSRRGSPIDPITGTNLPVPALITA